MWRRGFATLTPSTTTQSMLRWMWEHRPPKRVVLGVAIATPVAAVLQGVFLLNDFRHRHADAPTPVTPSRGVVVAVHRNISNNNPLASLTKRRNPAVQLGELMVQSVTNNNITATSTLLEESSQEPPLRILVIGDSLAAGVGVSETGTPVLPESIARTLSQRLGGRPVYWTCVGTPGASASRIAHDIETYQESLLVRKPTVPTELIVTENVIQGIQRQSNSLQARRDRLHKWWKSLGQAIPRERKDSPDDSGNFGQEPETEPRRIVRWWRHVKEGVHSFREAWKEPDEVEKDKPGNTLSKSNDSEMGEESNTVEVVDPFQMWQRWRQRLQRRSSLRNPDIVGQFDVAIVLTGLNDLKEAVLPFMFRGQNASSNAEFSEEKKSLLSELEGVLQALQQRMKLVLDRNQQKDEKEQENSVEYTLDDDDNHYVGVELQKSIDDNKARLAEKRETARRKPVVVFPALPVSPLPIFHSQPLRWFALPLFRRVDNYKRKVAERFPGEVLFVETPTDDEFSQIERGAGSLWEERRTEQVLLRLTDITQRARANVENVMRQHYEKWKQKIGVKDSSHGYNRPTPEEAQNSSELEAFHRPGSTLISVDGVHPNDAGYEFWGRHIANAICEEWEAQDRRRAATEVKERK